MPVARRPACSAPARLPGGPGRGSGVGAPPGRDAEKRMQNGQRFDLGTCFDSAHCSRHRSPRAEHETPALMPPASARKASASRHRPASGFCKHWRASTAPGRARAATPGTFRRVTFCCGHYPSSSHLGLMMCLELPLALATPSSDLALAGTDASSGGGRPACRQAWLISPPPGKQSERGPCMNGVSGTGHASTAKHLRQPASRRLSEPSRGTTAPCCSFSPWTRCSRACVPPGS